MMKTVYNKPIRFRNEDSSYSFNGQSKLYVCDMTYHTLNELLPKIRKEIKGLTYHWRSNEKTSWVTFYVRDHKNIVNIPDIQRKIKVIFNNVVGLTFMDVVPVVNLTKVIEFKPSIHPSMDETAMPTEVTHGVFVKRGNNIVLRWNNGMIWEYPMDLLNR